MKFHKNYRNTWTIKNPKYNLSKEQIRETIAIIGKEYGYGYIFGTPRDWDFDGPTIPITIANMEVKTMLEDKFKAFVDTVVREYEKLSGRKITYTLSTHTSSYEEYNVARFEYSEPLITITVK